jgi:hypothetical protein
MASILLRYASADEHEAKRLFAVLEAFLEREGPPWHEVTCADPSKPVVENADVVIVIWSPAAIASPYVYETARVALREGSLVQVITPELALDQLPAVFRVKRPKQIGDRKAILRNVASLLREQSSSVLASAVTRRDGFAEYIIPPPRPEAGQLAHRIPDKMRVGETEIVEVRLGRAYQNMAVGLQGSGELATEELPIVETMTVDLHGSPGAFAITRRSRPTQLVKGSLIWNTAFADQRFGRWLWDVTPKKLGTHELVVTVSADMSDSRGVATSESYADRTFTVKVHVSVAQASVRVLGWTAAGTLSGLVGAYTHEIWWPKLRALLDGAGL